MPENTPDQNVDTVPDSPPAVEPTGEPTVPNPEPETLTGSGPRTVEQYLAALRQALAGQDPALIQDALYDAEEYLRNELEAYHAEQPDLPPAAAFVEIVDKYGSPAEVGAAYVEADERFPSALPSPGPFLPPRSPMSGAGAAAGVGVAGAATAAGAAGARPGLLRRFFGVLVDPRAYLAVLFMFFSLATGIFYFTYLVTGLSVSLGLLAVVVGVPLLVLFIASVRVIALVEGRLVEAMTGERMPRRPFLSRKGQGWWSQLKGWLSDSATWTTMLYMGLMLPLGIFYFSFFVTLFSVALALVAAPVLHWVLGLPLFHIQGAGYTLEDWAIPLLPVAGILLGICSMHLARGFAFVHGRLAKALLVSP